MRNCEIPLASEMLKARGQHEAAVSVQGRKLERNDILESTEKHDMILNFGVYTEYMLYYTFFLV